MQIYQALKEDHRNLIHILERLEGTTEDASKLRRELLDDLELQLLSHAAAEEQAFLAPLTLPSDTRDAAVETAEDMSTAIKLLRGLVEEGAKNDHWTEHFLQLKELIESHIERDEKWMFDKAQNHLSGDAAESLGEKFDEVKNDIIQRNQLN